MESLKRFAIIVTFLLGGGLSDISSAQHTLNPRSNMQLSEAFDDAKREWTYTMSDGDRPPSLSDVGLVFVTGDSDIIQTIDRDGTIVWEKRSPEGMATVDVQTSSDGRFVRLVHLRNETNGTVELLTSDGQTLWTKDLNSLPKTQFSRSGDYMLSDPDFLFPTPVVVFETRTGHDLWRRDGKAVAVRGWGENKLAYVENNTISSADLTNGRTLWSYPFDVLFPGVGPGVKVWDIVSSENGRKLAVSVRKRLTTRIGGFDQTGNLLWRQDVDGIVTLLGITPDGRFLTSMVYRPGNTQLKLTDADTGTEIWTLLAEVYDIGFNVIMNDRLIFSKKGGTLILTIDSSGRLRDQALLPRMSIEYVGLRTGPSSSQNQTFQLSGRSSSRNQTSPRTVLLLKDVQSGRTFFIETIER